MIELILLAIGLYLLDDLTTYKIAKDFPNCIEDERNPETRRLLKTYGPKGVFYGWKILVENIILLILLVLWLDLFWFSFYDALRISLIGFSCLKLYAVTWNSYYYYRQRKIFSQFSKI
ncbi:MAG: hypothetical protein ACE5K4_10930 [Candidatus Hydrothermarchaeota archaeon]